MRDDHSQEYTMRTWRALAALAWRESRTARRRLLLSMSSIALGVAALVSIDSFAANLTRSVREQSRALLGGDIAFASNKPFGTAAESLFDSLARNRAEIARVTKFPSMAVAQRSGNTRLVPIHAVSGNYPLYGAITTEPAGRWSDLGKGAHALIDPSLLVALNTRIGDSVAVGYARFLIVGTVKDVPGTPGIAEMIGPRVFIPARYLAETQLLVFGSTASYEAFAKFPSPSTADKLANKLRPALRAMDVRVRSAERAEEGITDAIEELTRFIGLVGLIALLLGGLGVASGVHAFVARKIDTVAILRCLGATSGQVMAIYAAQATIMGIAGAAFGAALGVAIQFLAPLAIGDFLPVDVAVRAEPAVIATGLLVGGWVALAFALRPLVALRQISPLQTLRRDADSKVLRMRWNDLPRVLVSLAVVASVVGVAAMRASSPLEALQLSAGAGVGLLALAAAAALVALVARKGIRPGWPYTLRQGLANLHRPANQTRSVMLALGFGVFLVTALYAVQSSLLRRFTLGMDSSSANLVFFDIQPDQAPGVDSIVRGRAERIVQRAPVVPMRISAINGFSARDSATEHTPAGSRARWALRREYRSTFRDTLVASEKLTAGTWHGRRSYRPGDTTGISVEKDLARDLKLALGDIVTWDVQGVQVPTRITSLREVNWTRFEPNFFVVFAPEALRTAPTQYILLARTGGSLQSAQLQRAMVARFPNVSSIDLSLVQTTIGKILDKVAVAMRFLALFSLAVAVPVLVSSVAATRRERVREGVLLKTLGATRAQVGHIMLAEYAALGILGSLTGILLGLGAAWALVTFIFDSDFAPALGTTALVAALMAGLTILIGLLGSRAVFHETPMAALREQ